MRYYIFEYFFNKLTGCYAVREVGGMPYYTQDDALRFVFDKQGEYNHLLVVTDEVKPYVETMRLRAPSIPYYIARSVDDLKDYRL